MIIELLNVKYSACQESIHVLLVICLKVCEHNTRTLFGLFFTILNTIDLFSLVDTGGTINNSCYYFIYDVPAVALLDLNQFVPFPHNFYLQCIY